MELLIKFFSGPDETASYALSLLSEQEAALDFPLANTES